MPRTGYLLDFGKFVPIGMVLLFFPLLSGTGEEMTLTFVIGGARIDVTIDAGKFDAPQTEVMRWVKSAAESVTAYYRRFPVPHLTLRIASFEGTGVRHGQTFGRDGGLITISVGKKTPPSQLAGGWMLTHDIVPLAFPSVETQHHAR